MAWLLLLLVSFTGCASARPAAATPQADPVQAREVVIDLRPRAVTVTAGDTLVVRSSGLRWTAAFDSGVLELLSPTGGEAASSREWRFRAHAVGSTDVTFTARVAAPCPTPPDCPPPPAPPRVVIQVQVTP
jgi:hypothetical protein